jgi:uncharacterized protein YidB (DUF937 family)
MDSILGGSGLDVLETILGGGSKRATKSTKTKKSTKTTKSTKTKKGAGVDLGTAATLLPALLALLGSGGLEKLIALFGANGLGDIIGSWVGAGPNKRITSAQVKKSLGPDIINQLSSQSGLSPTQVASNLTTVLPGLVNHLTPEGQVPSATNLSSALQGLQALLPR